VVRKSFKTGGISNALDGTEEGVVFTEETPETKTTSSSRQIVRMKWMASIDILG